ncbi:MAG: hypothetical protein WCF47_10790 [Pseudolabrys sp.]
MMRIAPSVNITDAGRIELLAQVCAAAVRFTLKADIREHQSDAGFVPKADIQLAKLDVCPERQSVAFYFASVASQAQPRRADRTA